MARTANKRHSNKKVNIPDEIGGVKVRTALTCRDVPDRSIMFSPHEVERIPTRMNQIEEKLYKRHIKVIRPLQVWRWCNMLYVTVEKI